MRFGASLTLLRPDLAPLTLVFSELHWHLSAEWAYVIKVRGAFTTWELGSHLLAF